LKRCGSCVNFAGATKKGKGLCEYHDWMVKPDRKACSDFSGKKYSRKVKHKVDEVALASEPSLSKTWLTPEEDDAWKDL